MTKNFKLAIFDLDGVLVDTASNHYIAWKKLSYELFRYDFTEEENEQFKGVSRLTCMNILCDLAGAELDESKKVEYANLKNDWYVESIGSLTEENLLPGAKELLIELRECGVKIALGSASKNAQYILGKLNIEEYFDLVVDGNTVAKAKPDPEVFVAASDKLMVEPSKCVVFEDAYAGIEAAHRGGMYAIGVGSKEILYNADMIVESLNQVVVDDLF